MEYIEKRVRAKKYYCKNCGNNFYRYSLSCFQYGERFLFTESTKRQVYFNCFNNEEFMNEISQIIYDYFPCINKIEESRIFNIILGRCCDKVGRERLVSEADEEVCEVCLSNDVMYINNSDTIVEAKLPCVTHNKWDSYNYDNKKDIIYEELKLHKLL